MILLLLSLLLSAQVHAFETCTPENDYLEAGLPAPDPAGAAASFPQICVESAHLSMPPQGYYGFCPTPAGRPVRDHKRACISEKFVAATHTALVDVTDCLGYDTRLAFATLALESALHMNAVGAATDVGIGQLTKSAIDEVNINAFDRALRQMQQSAKPSCARILPLMSKGGSAIDDRCAFMSLPENPVRNLIYSVLLLQQNRRVVNNLWARYQIELPPAVNAERLKTLLAMLAYNSGPAGIMSVLKSYVAQMGPQLTDQHFDFEGPDEGGFARYLNANFPSNDPAVRKRVSKYVGYVMASTRRFDKAAGGRQECIHAEYLNPPVRALAGIRAPNRAQAHGLVKAYASDMADGFTNCHDFEFAFLGKTLKARDLSPRLRAVHYRLCQK
jgi:hypothetical protein